jgi:hypothetical protein
MYETEKEKLAEQDDKIFLKAVIIVMVAAFLWWLMFYLINQ